MSDSRIQLQQSLGDAYAIERELGGGGMSRVFVAQETALGRDVVVKLLSTDLASTISAERFTREIRTVAALQEPHIVPVLAAGQTADGLPWFTMPYVRGESLRARLAQGTIPPAEALGVLRNVAQALAYAHARGVVHRDIKPENVLLSSGTAVVADFGIAKALNASRTQASGETLTQAGMAVGTPAYMSPEQATGDLATDHRTDVYAWGVMAYELLGGGHPFAGRATAAKMTAAHLAEVPARLVAPGVSTAFADLVMRTLEKDPARRPASMEEVLAVLAAEPTPGSAARAATAPTASYPRAPWVALALGTIFFGAIGWFMLKGRERAGAASASDRASVAVLPFNEIGGGDNAYFGDGIAETLISALGQVQGLDVAARTSAFAFRGKNTDVHEIASKLGVSTVLEGSVQRAGDQLRITAHLVRARDGGSLWTQTFDRNAKDIFAVQDEVARAVIGALRGQVLAGAARGVASSTRDPAAYDLYLRARFEAAKRTGPALARAVALYTDALARDTGYAQAWSGLADAYILQGLYADTGSRARMELARKAADRALAIDGELVEALTTNAYLLIQDWNWAASDTAFQHALRAGPSYALAHKWYGDFFFAVGRVAERRRSYERAWQLDPLSSAVAGNLGQDYLEAGDSARAMEWFDRSLALDPNLPLALRSIAPILLVRGDTARFFDVEARLLAGSSLAGASVPTLRAAWNAGGVRAVAATQVSAFERARLPFEAMQWYLLQGNLDGAFAALDRAITARNAWVPFTPNYINTATIRRDPRYAQARRRLHVPEDPR